MFITFFVYWHNIFSTRMDIYRRLCNGWKWASMVCKWKYYISLSCECWSYHDHAPYLDLALQFFWLLLLIKEHWFAKNELNSSAFFLKSVIYLLSSKSGGIQKNYYFPLRRSQIMLIVVSFSLKVFLLPTSYFLSDQHAVFFFVFIYCWYVISFLFRKWTLFL